MPIHSKDIIKTRAATTLVNSANSGGTPGRWTKIASAEGIATNLRKTSSIILASIIHDTSGTDADGTSQYNFIISAQYARVSNTVDVNETYVHVEPIGNWSTTNTWDASTYLALTYDGLNSAEIWIRSSESYSLAYATVIGGGGGQSGNYSNGSFSIETGQNWSANLVSLGDDVVGSWASKELATLKASLVGNASSATSASTVTVTNDTNTDAEHYVTFVGATSGNQAINTDSTMLRFNPGTDVLTTGHIRPISDDSYDIGSSTLAFQDCYLEGDLNFTDSAQIDVASGNLTIDVAGDITLDAAGDQIRFKDAGSERITFNLSSTPEIDVAGDFTVDCSGDIILDADGGQIYFTDNGTIYLTFNVDGTTDSIAAAGHLTLDATGDITLDADGGQVRFKDNGTTYLTFNVDGTTDRIDATGNLTFDVSGDITLDAAGDQIRFKDAGTERIVFNLDSTPEMDVAGSFTIDCSGDITLDADGGDILFKDNGASLGSITSAGYSGNSATATTLKTARTIGGVSFNGSANINLPGVNIAGNQNTSGNAATATSATNATNSSKLHLSVSSTSQTRAVLLGPAVTRGSSITAPGNETIFVDADSYLTYTPSENKLISTNALFGTLEVNQDIIGSQGNTVIKNSAGGYIELKSNNSSYGVIIRDYNSSNWGNISANNGYLELGYNNNSGPLYIADNDNVGIGNSAPPRKLSVLLNAAESSIFVDNGNTTNSAAGLQMRLGPNTNPSSACKYVWMESGNGTDIGYIQGDGSGGITITDAFTGSHPSIMPAGDFEPGLIVESTGELWANAVDHVNSAIPQVVLSSTDASKKVYGVLSEKDTHAGYVEAWGCPEGKEQVYINGLGEGKVWVTDRSGNIENGDYITTSIIPGYGMKQSDDILRSCTVAKCVENIDWDSVSETIEYDGKTYKKYLAGCTYHCS